MFKLLVLSCLLVSCLADPFSLPSWFREAGRAHRHPRGCADRAQGWRACARVNSSDSLAPHGRDCSLFFYCSSSARPACRKCPAGLHFNPQLQVCDWPEHANCTQRPPRPHHNGTTPYPTTTPDDDATYATTDGSTDGTTTIDASTADATTADATTTDASSTEPSVFSWQNYIPWVRK